VFHINKTKYLYTSSRNNEVSSRNTAVSPEVINKLTTCRPDNYSFTII